MTDTVPVPELPTLEITAGSKKKGLNQQIVDETLKSMYADKPDLFVRIARREGDFPDAALRDHDADVYDDTVKEFHLYVVDYVSRHAPDLDTKKVLVWTGFFWEARRRARMMYGMHI